MRPNVLRVTEPSAVRYCAPMDEAPALSAAWQHLRGDLQRFVAARVSDKSAVDDILQETFVKVYERGAQLRDEEHLAAWVFRIARNTIHDHGRRASRNPVRLGESEVDDRPADDDADDANLNEVIALWLKPFIATLPATYREALELTELGGLTQTQLSEHLGISVSGAKTRVQRGRRLLRQAIEGCCALELDTRGNVIDFQRRDGHCPCSGDGSDG